MIVTYRDEVRADGPYRDGVLRITIACTGVAAARFSLCLHVKSRHLGDAYRYPTECSVVAADSAGHSQCLDLLIAHLLLRFAPLHLLAFGLPDRYCGPNWSIPTVARVAGHRRGGTPAIHDQILAMIRSPIPKTFTAIQDLFMWRRPVDVFCFAGYARSNVAASRRCFLLAQVMLVSHRCFPTACTHYCASCMKLVFIVSHADG
ncbi:hypothetical protein LF1_53070 [Rubripirellula obstinata]|uniref:Uncharacterized protein n=1 Tax=Rubripirellula obstinata TaxID=406547 RepID=A0A5B1C8K5_9BACT|nr:hypothetical protein LF1_53070 [Rubripirellula obstinata]